MRSVSVQDRRRAMVRRHHLDGDADGPLAVTRALLALHATDPASAYLSVLARAADTTIAEVSATMYERRELVRWMAMRRTLFVVAREDVPVVQAAVSTPLSRVLRRRLVSQLERNGTDPPVDGDVGRWLGDLEGRVEEALTTRATATGAQLSADVPSLRTAIVPRAPSDRPANVTSALLTVMSAEGRIVRATPTGAWTSRPHRWEPVGRWWPEGLPELDEAEAQRALAARWLACFAPATPEDLTWWTGWTKGVTRRALAALPLEEVDLHGTSGIALADDAVEGPAEPATEPVATLLPALDPTPMGYLRRDWLFGIPQDDLFDRNGNIGPTLWWDGEVVGSWAVAPTGELRLGVIADRGAVAEAALHEAAARLQDRLGGAVVTPVARTPLERSLAEG